FCVRWPRPIGSGANHFQFSLFDSRFALVSAHAAEVSTVVDSPGRQLPIRMSRSTIIALLIFGAILGYFLSFGSDTTRKFQSAVYQWLAPLFTTGSGLQKQITSVRTQLKSLEDLERENSALQVDNRQLRATNQALRDVER